VTRPFRVLAVEDDADTLTLMRLMLRNLPLEITHAATGAEAVAWLAAGQPDLILLDLNLPDMRGWSLLEQIKAQPRFAQTPVIVLTSHAEPVHRLIGHMQPITAYLKKPVQSDQLRQIVRSALSLA
jgi:CheY-like chemotaxis protein